jgi:outer membrane protein
MTSKNILRLSALLLTATLGTVHAAQDLLAIYHQAVSDDPELAAARAQLQADEERLDQARSLFLPRVGLEVDAARVHQSLEYTGSAAPANTPGFGNFDGEYSTRSLGIELTQPLFRMESFTIYKQAKTLTDQAQLSYAVARQELTLRVSDAYFDVLQAQNAVGSFDAELSAIQEQLNRAQRTFELGVGTVTDVNEAQARLDLTQAQRLRALNQLRIARETLQRTVGAPVGELAEIRPSFQPEPATPASAEAWAELAEAANLQVQLAQAGFEFAQDEVTRQRAQRYPKIDLYARYGYSYQSRNITPELDGEEAAVGVNLSVPIYTGGAISSQIRVAQADKAQALARVRAAKRSAALAAESAYLSLTANLQQIRALEQALKSIRLNVESTRKGLELGLRTVLDVLDIERELYAAQRDLAAARYGYLLNYLQLRAAVGEAVEADAVQAINQFLTEQP